MSNEISIVQQIRVANGNFKFPAVNQGWWGQNNQQPNQTTPGVTLPALSAITTGQGTLLDLSALSPAVAGGGWAMFYNEDITNFVTWGIDDGAGNLKKVGEMLPGEFAGPFRISRNQQKFRFLADTAACAVLPLILTP